MEIYITSLLQILSFSSCFRLFEIKNFLRRLSMVADNITQLVAPPEFFSFLRAWQRTKHLNFGNIFSLLKLIKPSPFINFPFFCDNKKDITADMLNKHQDEKHSVKQVLVTTNKSNNKYIWMLNVDVCVIEHKSNYDFTENVIENL